MKTKRFRLQHTFWLDMLKPDEAALAEVVEDLKAKRTFVTTVRDGIRLVCDLRAGRLDVLFELFPWVRAEFLDYLQALQPLRSPAEIELQKRLERMESLLLQQGNVPVANTTSGPKPLVAAKSLTAIAEPDEADLLVVKQAKANGNSAQNFLDAAFGLIQ